MKDNYVFKQDFLINKNQRAKKLNQRPKLIFFTGLSGSGKSTLSNALDNVLFEKGYTSCCLDGDNIRLGLSKDLGFSAEDRSENIRRIAEVSKLFLDSGIIVLASFILPLKINREQVKKIVGVENYIEIHVSTPIEVCEKRDVKGLYKKARKGEIKNFTGLSSEFESPVNPSLKIDTSKLTIDDSVQIIFEQIKIQINV